LVHEVGDALAQLFGLGGQRKVHFDPLGSDDLYRNR
jgi:hypothetical protein